MERDAIGLELRRLNNLIMRYIENNMNKKLPSDITWSNTWVLGYLAENADSGRDIFQKDLEAEFNLTRSTVSKVIDLLVKKGYIARQSVDRDARLKKLILTPKAQAISAIMRRDADMTESVLTNGFSEEDIEILSKYIYKMKENILGNRNRNPE